MNKEEAIRFAGLMEDYLNIPSFVCEMIQQLEENKYKEVVEYVIQRRNEIESKPDFISDRNAITMLVNQNEQKDKEIERLNNIIEELEKDLKKNLQDCRKRKWVKNYAKSTYAQIQEDVYDYMLYRLKTLKEGNMV